MLTREEETPEVPKIEGSYMAFVEKSYNVVFDVEIDGKLSFVIRTP